MEARILIIEDDLVSQKLHRKVIESAGYKVTMAADGLEGLSYAKEQDFDLVISDVMMPNMDGYETCQRLRENPKTAQIPILLLTALDNLKSKIKGFEAGADDYLSKPYEPDELVARVSVLLRRKPVPVEPRQTLEKKGKMIGVFSLRDGVGVSTIAVNLATGLAQLWGQESVLVDLALTAGQAALMLNLPLRNTWADLAHMEAEEIDQEVLSQTLRSHPSGVHVLSAPRRVEDGELIQAAKVNRVLEILQQSYDYIVLDLPHNFSETTLAGLDIADEILVVLAPELASVRSTAMALEVFEPLEYSLDSTRLILNWVFERQGLSVVDIEAVLSREIKTVIPFASEQFVRAINYGTPPVLDEPESTLGVIFEDLAFWVSQDDHKKLRPEEPTEAWKRLAKRMRKRRQ
ncbi:MAG: response regulator [Chloroflexi bacterium]|nr:response regulator [Chloroflexota bacterium]MBL7164811.1 response regulator [Anaerolineales bacterium]